MKPLRAHFHPLAIQDLVEKKGSHGFKLQTSFAKLILSPRTQLWPVMQSPNLMGIYKTISTIASRRSDVKRSNANVEMVTQQWVNVTIRRWRILGLCQTVLMDPRFAKAHDNSILFTTLTSTLLFTLTCCQTNHSSSTWPGTILVGHLHALQTQSPLYTRPCRYIISSKPEQVARWPVNSNFDYLYGSRNCK